MILIYLDESGTNYQNRDGLFVDGPFVIMGAMLVQEDVYWNLERMFSDLINQYFGIDNWFDNEIHATDIWAGKKQTKDIPLDRRRQFFDDFLQMCGKFGLPVVFSFQQ